MPRSLLLLVVSAVLVACSGGSGSAPDAPDPAAVSPQASAADVNAPPAPDELTSEFLSGTWCEVNVAGGKTEFDFEGDSLSAGEPGGPKTLSVPIASWFGTGAITIVSNDEFFNEVADLGVKNTYTRGPC